MQGPPPVAAAVVVGLALALVGKRPQRLHLKSVQFGLASEFLYDLLCAFGQAGVGPEHRTFTRLTLVLEPGQVHRLEAGGETRATHGGGLIVVVVVWQID